MNWIAIAISTIIPLVIGFGWYNKATFGNAWMAASGLTMDDAKKVNMGAIMAVLLVMSFFLTFGLHAIVIHQDGLNSLLLLKDGSVNPDLAPLMEKYGSSYRSFGHGALHGFIASVVLAMPILSFSALFEGKRAKYILIHWGYWAVCMMLMGGVLCAMK